MHLIEVIKQNNVPEIQKALSTSKLNINKRDSKGMTALMHACERKNYEIIKILLKQPHLDLDLKDQSVNSELALMMASPISGDPQSTSSVQKDIVNSFLELPSEKLKSSPNTINYALQYYTWIGEAAGVNRCLELGADPNNLHLGMSPLTHAVSGNYASIVQRLMDHPQIDPNQPDYRGDTPIISAIAQGYAEIASRFVQNPTCDLSSCSYLYGTPLTAAIFSNGQDLAKKLLESGRLDVQKELPAFLLAIQRDEWAWVYRDLLERGFNVNQDCSEFYKWLMPGLETLRQEADARTSLFGNITCQPKIGNSKDLILDRPVWVALHSNKQEALQLFLAEGADLSTSSSLGIDKWYQQLSEDDPRKIIVKKIQKQMSENKLIGAAQSDLKKQTLSLVFAYSENVEPTTNKIPMEKLAEMIINMLKSEPKIYAEVEKRPECLKIVANLLLHNGEHANVR